MNTTVMNTKKATMVSNVPMATSSEASAACDGDGPRRRAQARMHGGGRGREHAVLRHGHVEARRDHLHRPEAAEHADDHDGATTVPPPLPTMASPTWAMNAWPSATCPIGTTAMNDSVAAV